MKISEQGIALIKKFEGFSAKPYLCPAGKWTIGFGHLLKDSGFGIQDSGISEKEAESLLQKDLAPVEAAINRLVRVPLSQNQFDALCSLIYNIGVGAFAKSTLLKLLNESHETPHQVRGDAIGRQFARWVYGGGKKLAGLEARRKAEAALFGA